MRKLELSAAHADLAAIQALLDRRSPQTDPAGWFQFSKRRDQVRQHLVALEAQVSRLASVALFFGGLPVVGSRGIKAEFGTKAVDQFQDVLKKRFAEHQGPIGSRGPTKSSDQMEMMITDVARGSFGFVLEEIGDAQLTDSALSETLADVLDLISDTSSPDEAAFSAFLDAVDPRVLGSLKTFFQHLNDNGATLKIVENSREITLPRDAIERAFARTSATEIHEGLTLFKGKIFLLPVSRRFDMHFADGSSFSGSISPNFFKQFESDNDATAESFSGKDYLATIRVRSVRSARSETRYVYRLEPDDLTISPDTMSVTAKIA